jgi:hypothetical protein
MDMRTDSTDATLTNLNTQLVGDQFTNANQTFDFYKSPEELLYDFFWEAYFEKKPPQKPSAAAIC